MYDLDDLDDLTRIQLLSLIAQRGITAWLYPQQFEAELLGVCGDCEKEVFVLLTALKKDVVSELVRASDPSPISERMARITQRLCDIGLERRAATWAVEMWALGLGLFEAAQSPPDEPTAPVSIEYECPSCHVGDEADGPGRIVCEDCGWAFEVDADGTTRAAEGLIVVECPSCKQEGQHAPDSESDCDCGRRLVLGKDGRILNVEVECPNPDGDCGVIHQFIKAELPKRVVCECDWAFEVDSEGRTRKPQGLIDATCPFCERNSQHFSAGEVECPNPECERRFSIDKNGRVLTRTIEAECPKGCGTIQNVVAAGRVVCEGCGYEYTIDEDGDVVDPGEDVWEVECEDPDCKAKFYKEPYSEDEHFAGGYSCPYCGHWHSHEEHEEDEEDQDEDEDEDDDFEEDEGEGELGDEDAVDDESDDGAP